MPQVKIYGRVDYLESRQAQLIAGINANFETAMAIAGEKIVYRFFPLENSDFCYEMSAATNRSERYLVVEIALFAGRSAEIKTAFIAGIYDTLTADLSCSVNDLEILLWELPAGNWGLRGSTGEKLLSK
jgi:phenylpyruvate tautomerase PptA (4-oxalocrotonate tautomerase family)